MHKMIRRVATVGGFVLVFAASTTWAQETVRVRGTIQRVEGQTCLRTCSAPAKDFGEFGTTIGLRCRCRDDDVLDFDLLVC